MICVVPRPTFHEVAVHQRGLPGFSPPVGIKVFAVLLYAAKIHHLRQVVQEVGS